MGVKLQGIDPKPGDLAMGRVQVGYRYLEARTDET